MLYGKQMNQYINKQIYQCKNKFINCQKKIQYICIYTRAQMLYGQRTLERDGEKSPIFYQKVLFPLPKEPYEHTM